MQRVNVVVRPGAERTRVLAVEAGEVVLKARLLPSPAHPRAMQWLLEAVALWQGHPVHAALFAAEPGGSSLRLWRADWFDDFGNALYQLEVVQDEARRSALVDCIRGMGEFRKLKEVLRAAPESHGERRWSR